MFLYVKLVLENESFSKSFSVVLVGLVIFRFSRVLRTIANFLSSIGAGISKKFMTLFEFFFCDSNLVSDDKFSLFVAGTIELLSFMLGSFFGWIATSMDFGDLIPSLGLKLDLYII